MAKEKSLFKSKTFWVGALFVLTGFASEFGVFLSGLPEGTSWTLILGGAVQIALRLITKEAVKLSW